MLLWTQVCCMFILIKLLQKNTLICWHWRCASAKNIKIFFFHILIIIFCYVHLIINVTADVFKISPSQLLKLCLLLHLSIENLICSREVMEIVLTEWLNNFSFAWLWNVLLCFLLQYKTCFHCSSTLFFYFSQQTTLFWVEVEVKGFLIYS